MRFAIILSILSVTATAHAGTNARQTVRQPGSKSTKLPEVSDMSSGVRVTGSLSSSVVVKGGQFSGFVTLANSSAQSLSRIQIIVYVPDGFSFQGARIEQNPAAALPCAPQNPAVPSMLNCDVPNGVDGGMERAFTLTWRADTDQAERSMNVVVEWLPSTASSPSSRALSLGQISSEAPWKLWVARNPLVLPLVTGVLGGLIVALAQAWLASRQRKLEDQRAARAKLAEEGRAKLAKIEEEVRAAATRKLEEERAHKIATWDMMLPQAHKLAMRHYVHMQSFVRGAISSLDRYDRAASTGGSMDPEFQDLPVRAFLCLLLFARRMQYSTDTVGGLYFKNRIGEEVVARCFYAYRKLYFDTSVEARSRYEAIVRRISPKARVSELYDAMNAPVKVTAKAGPAAVETAEFARSLRSAFEEFEALWIKKNQRRKVLPVLKGFAAVMQFEMNRPYRYWYNERAVLEISQEAREAVETLGEKELFGMNDNWKLFRDSAKAYLQIATTSGTDDPA